MELSLFWQRRKKCFVFSVSRIHEHSGITGPASYAMRENCPNTEVFLGDLRSKFPYSVRIQEGKNQKKIRTCTHITQ